MIDLAGRPFFLNDDSISWVRQTLADMDTEAKIGQLFCLLGRDTDRVKIEETLKVVKPGGYLIRPN